MATIVVPLQEFRVGSDNPIDLTGLPEDQAVALIRKTFGFLSSSLHIAINGDAATITLPPANAERADEALRLYQRGVKQAEKGEYLRAIKMFQQVLSALPEHVDARRNLGMAYQESGDKQRAKQYLLETLRLDPGDAWSHLLLGNIYSKQEKNDAEAEKHYQRAYELKPVDAILLTNYGAMRAEQGRLDEARRYFEEAIQADGRYPNSYYGLALLHFRANEEDRAVAVLDQMFAMGKAGDVRLKALYEESRKLYFEAIRKQAEKSYPRQMEIIEERKRALETRTGYGIDIQEVNTLDGISGITEIAWKHKRERHLIKYRMRSKAMTPHLLAHELIHIELEDQARKAGKNKHFATTAENREHAIRSIHSHIRKLQRSGYPEAAITEVVRQMTGGLANQLYNMPLDMIIEYRIAQELPELKPSEFVALETFHGENLNAFTNQNIEKLTPANVYRANIAINIAYALFMDALYGARTEYAAAYRKADALPTGQKLFGLWQEAIKSFKPGDEFDLVDAFARVLGLTGWYTWRPDDMLRDEIEEALKADDLATSPQGSTNPDLLKSKEMASVMYLLGTLQRFEDMSTDEIRKIGFEIGVLGREGLDYASTDRNYTLRSIPDETFSGLQLMCLMYAAFQRIDPSVDTGIDLRAAYHQALRMHGAKSV